MASDKELLASLGSSDYNEVMKTVSKKARQLCDDELMEYMKCTNEHPIAAWKCKPLWKKCNECTSQYTTPERIREEQLRFLREREKNWQREGMEDKV